MTSVPRGPILPFENVDETLPPDLPGGFAGALGTLRHALADPLSAAGLKLELLERRLEAVPPNGSSLADRVRGAKADLAAAGRLIDLLPRLAAIAGEAPSETSIDDLCRVAGIPLDGDPASGQRLLLRRLASVDALRIMVWFLRSQTSGEAAPDLRAVTGPGQAALRMETGGPWNGSVEGDLARIFLLPRSGEKAEELFLARACVESDGGSLRLGDREGRMVATFSWPRPVAAGDGGRPE